MKRYWTVVERPAGGFQIGWLERGRIELLTLDSIRYDTYKEAAAAADYRNSAGIQRSLLLFSRPGGVGIQPAPALGREGTYI